MEILRTLASIRDFRKGLRLTSPEKILGLVPTMGYLHEGHGDLIRESRSRCDLTIVSIFVNPLQFNNPHDLATYPRNEKGDLKFLESLGVDAVFIPDPEEIYPENEERYLDFKINHLDQVLCGPGRPGHFEGVLVIVSRLFHLILPDLAFFGKKDYQQYVIIKRLVRELDFPLEIVGCETRREEDGLAMSSRNARLDESSRDQALLIHRALLLGRKAVRDRGRTGPELCDIVKDVIETGGLNRVEYVQVVDPETLEILDSVDRDSRFVIATAVHCGPVRLIDNLEHFPEE